MMSALFLLALCAAASATDLRPLDRIPVDSQAATSAEAATSLTHFAPRKLHIFTDDSPEESTPLPQSATPEGASRPSARHLRYFAVQAEIPRPSSADVAESNSGGFEARRELQFRAQNRMRGCTITVGPREKFTRIQPAVDSIGKNPASRPVKVCIRAGEYYGQVRIGKAQEGITLEGEGFGTIIWADETRESMKNVFRSATVFAEGNFFRARYIAIENRFQSKKNPNVAVTLSANQTTLEYVSLTSWSDTLAVRTGASHLVTNCYISGSTDITFGFGRVAFVNTQFYIRDWKLDPNVRYTGHIGTYGTDKNSNGIVSGAVYWNCKIDGEGRTYLGRPYREVTSTVYVNCFMFKGVNPLGWDDYKGTTKAKKYDYREYDSYGPGAAITRRYGVVFRQVSVPKKYTVAAFIGRTS